LRKLLHLNLRSVAWVGPVSNSEYATEWQEVELLIECYLLCNRINV